MPTGAPRIALLRVSYPPHLNGSPKVNRSARLVTAALTVSTAMLLTACGSGGSDDSSSDKIKGADAGAASSSSASASAASDIKRPKITLPRSLQVTFSGWKNSDPKLQAILDDGRQQLLGSYSAIVEADAESEAMTFYNTGVALTTGKEWVNGFVKNDLTLIGEARAYNPQTRISPDGSGTLFYCVDESKGATKNRKTGETTNTPADKAQVLYRTKLSKNDAGVWQTTTVTTTQGGCQ
ncbi:hypothetical protein HMPREF1211_07939 [Streptomyces sp. HGB0020]|nr:hypothetical protein HMPREF1211_08235 [Streptomyces sp. HGB0020]EPD55038.1 hypothetical protein HMPREF1211_07939 [Streptomyces sp. HGB0020]